MKGKYLDDAHKLISWASILDDETREQALRTAEMPFIFPHMALMPDAHLGKGATVGSVIPTQGAIIPAAIGVDIGCGMIAHRTGYDGSDLPKDRRSLREAIEKVVPLSAGRNNQGYYAAHTGEAVDRLEVLADEKGFRPWDYMDNWRLQLGSLGSGNHFIEVTVDQDDSVWLFLHSGSRGIGNKIAMHHIEVAKEWCRRWFVKLPKYLPRNATKKIPDLDLSYLIEGTPEFDRYIAEMQWAQEFAYANRTEMMRRLTDCFESWVGDSAGVDLEINCHHNYTTRERHFGQDVWLTRKGAIDAHEGTWGLIPGSMGTASYVVQGKGDRVALYSSPHGAGRNGSRAWARKAFSFQQLERDMASGGWGGSGIEWSHKQAFLDEIPGAYKDIDLVMDDSKDLVEVQHTLRQLINVKGS